MAGKSTKTAKQKGLSASGKSRIKPKALKPGDGVGIVAPASRPEGERAVEMACRLVEAMGFIPSVGKHVLSMHGYMAGTDSERAHDLNSFIKDKKVRAIFCIAGGFGSLRLVDKIDYEALASDPKIIVGSDENTALLLAVQKQIDLVSFHGFNLDCLKSQTAFDDFRRAVTSTRPLPSLMAESAAGLKHVKHVYAPVRGKARGILTGGNLSALFSLFGTRYQSDLKDKIIFLEDRNERNDILERWMTSLYLSGQLSLAKAVLMGSFEGCGPRGSSSMLPLDEIFAGRLKDLQAPSCFDMPIGQSGNCRVVPIGVSAAVDTGSGILEFLEPALTPG